MCKTTIVRFRCGHTVPTARSACLAHTTAVSRCAAAADAGCWAGAETITVDDQTHSCLFCRLDMLHLGDVGIAAGDKPGGAALTAKRPRGILKRPAATAAAPQNRRARSWWEPVPAGSAFTANGGAGRDAQSNKRVHFAADPIILGD